METMMPIRRFPRSLGGAITGALLLALPFQSGWAGESAQRGVKNVRSFLEMRHQRVVLQKWDLSCGAAALATILDYEHGERLTERYIAKTMLENTDSELVQKRLGFSLLDLKRFVDSHGYEGEGYGDMTLVDLARFGPAIVPVHINIYDHFVVFRGIHGNRVLLADPAYGNRTMPTWEFEKVWQKKVAFVVTRRDGGAPPDRLSAKADDFNIASDATIREAIR
jgi:predicted double-glycine peptidase